jgi:hypothetical protein
MPRQCVLVGSFACPFFGGGRIVVGPQPARLTPAGGKVLDFVLHFFSARAEKPKIREFRPKFRKFRVNLHVQT